MSIVAKITLASSIVLSAGIVYYVHHKQNLDRTSLHEGVLRDIERQKRRRAENLYMLQQQIDLSKELKKSQLAARDDFSSSTVAYSLCQDPAFEPEHISMRLLAQLCFGFYSEAVRP